MGRPQVVCEELSMGGVGRRGVCDRMRLRGCDARCRLSSAEPTEQFCCPSAVLRPGPGSIRWLSICTVFGRSWEHGGRGSAPNGNGVLLLRPQIPTGGSFSKKNTSTARRQRRVRLVWSRIGVVVWFENVLKSIEGESNTCSRTSRLSAWRNLAPFGEFNAVTYMLASNFGKALENETAGIKQTPRLAWIGEGLGLTSGIPGSYSV